MTGTPGDNMFDQFFGSGGFPYTSPPAKKKAEKGVPWEAKIIDGQYYVPLSQVADLLRENNVLPAVRKGIDKRVEAQALRVGQEKFNRTAQAAADVETGLCNGVAGQLHPFCIVSNQDHEPHMVEVEKGS